MEKESERQEEKVKKVCKRCHQNYTPSSNTPSSCRFHPSFFVCRRHDDQKRYTTLPRTLYLSIHLYESFMMFLHTHFLNFTAFLDTWIALPVLFNTHVLNWIICRIYMYIWLRIWGLCFIWILGFFFFCLFICLDILRSYSLRTYFVYGKTLPSNFHAQISGQFFLWDLF